MLRLLGVVFLLLICIGLGYWGVFVGAVLCVGWLLARPLHWNMNRGMCFTDEQVKLTNGGGRPLTAIPLLNAAYCANCDFITNSAHDECTVCGSHSLIGICQIWQLTFATATAQSAKFKVSFTADVQGIPAAGLKECTKLISRLAELGGNVNELHIQVDPAANTVAMFDITKVAALKLVDSADHAWHFRQQAS